MSYALAALHRDWVANLCPGCQQPYESHLNKTYRSYVGVYRTCPAVEAVDRERAKVVKADGESDDVKKFPPDRFRFWHAIPRAVAAAINDAKRQEGGTRGR